MTFITYYFENTCFFLIFAPTFFDIADKIVSYTTRGRRASSGRRCELLTKSYHIQLAVAQTCIAGVVNC